MSAKRKIITKVLTVANGSAADVYTHAIELDKTTFPHLKEIMVNTRANGGDANYAIGLVNGTLTVEEPHHHNNFEASTAVAQGARRYPIGLDYSGDQLYVQLKTNVALAADLVVEIAFVVTKTAACDA